MSDNWQISNEDLLADEDFAEAAELFGTYGGYDFLTEVQQVADRINTLHMERGVRAEFMFGFEANAEGEITSASVAVASTEGYSMYLYRWIDLKNLTNDREATGEEQAFAIRDVLMDAYGDVLELAAEKGLI